ncbi:MAG: hypothetical protein LBI64_02480, partial [Coriobacteriales bacterium]|nr:hypothetical protein [Coriobacteriales bacterium]
MFQDIAPHTLAIAFAPRALAPGDYLLAADTTGRLLMAERNGAPAPTLATCEELTSAFPDMADGARFLFTIDERAVFLARTAPGESRVTAGDGFAYHELFDLRD